MILLASWGWLLVAAVFWLGVFPSGFGGLASVYSD